MDRTEFKTWGEDFCAKFPESGKWLKALPVDTRTEWFEGLFINLELRDCLEANKRLLAEPIPAYERERIPSRVATIAQEVAFDREQRQRKAEQGSSRGAWKAVTRSNPVMAKMFAEVTERMAEYRRETGERFTPRELIQEFAREASERHDVEGDPADLPRYRCATCQDTGFVGRRVNGIYYAATCGDCEVGDRRAKGFADRGRPVGSTKNPNRVAAFDEWNSG